MVVLIYKAAFDDDSYGTTRGMRQVHKLTEHLNSIVCHKKPSHIKAPALPTRVYAKHQAKIRVLAISNIQAIVDAHV